jgi:mannan endo-1,4-beta-mannosidase
MDAHRLSLLAYMAFLAACSSSESSDGARTGGVSGTQETAGQGGAVGHDGGAQASGGDLGGAGGATNSGGATGTGGRATGGTGGRAGGGTGGTVSATGGERSIGGETSAAGASSTGGTNNVAGATSIDGASGAGGFAATGRFYVVGKDIVGPEGKLFFPFGANLAGSIARADGTLERPWTFDFGGTANGHSDDALAWGWTAVRINFVCYYEDQPDFASPEDLARGVAAIVEEYTAKKIVVMPECHDDTGLTLPLDDAHMQAADAFWDRVIAAHKDNPYVWINPLNELTSDANDAGQVEYWKQIARHYLDKRNAAGAENVLVMDIPGYAQGAITIADTDLGSALVQDECNLVLSWHAYGGAGAADTAQYETWYQRIQDRKIALLIGEHGYAIDGTPTYSAIRWQDSVDATDLVLSLGKQYGVGSMVWHGTGGSGDSLLFSLMADNEQADTAAFWNGSDGQGLSELGQKVWDAGHDKPTPATFTGSLAGSHCPSAH